MKTPISSAALTGDAMSKASVLTQPSTPSAAVTGEFVTMAGERYYAIRNVDKIPPFFISVVSDSDHWLFVASNGGLAAGRVSPDTSLFPYITVDKIYESTPHTGSKTLLRVELEGQHDDWEPFNAEHDNRFNINRNLYKNSLGNKLLFEEINHDLQLVFRYTWACSDRYGFVRQCEIENFGAGSCSIELLDGLQNLLPAGTPRYAQTNTSYLVDAYKWNELDEHTGLALFTLFSGITDRAEPSESLKATTVFSLGLINQRSCSAVNKLTVFVTLPRYPRKTTNAVFVAPLWSTPHSNWRQRQQLAGSWSPTSSKAKHSRSIYNINSLTLRH